MSKSALLLLLLAMAAGSQAFSLNKDAKEDAEVGEVRQGGDCGGGEEDDGGSDKCPSSHPYVYFNGQYCCATRRELNMNMMYGWGWGWGGIPGGQCSGGPLRVTSMCCEYDNYVRCPEFNCA